MIAPRRAVVRASIYRGLAAVGRDTWPGEPKARVGPTNAEGAGHDWNRFTVTNADRQSLQILHSQIQKEPVRSAKRRPALGWALEYADRMAKGQVFQLQGQRFPQG